MSTKHTPGPWTVSAGDLPFTVGPENGFAPFGGCGCCGSPWMNADDDETRLADARLIVAAPDLLACVQGFRQKLVTYTTVYPGDKALRRLLAGCDEAIAKATGGEV